MASPLTLSPDEFKKRYGDITAPESDVLLSLTPEEFNQRYNGKSAPQFEQTPAKPISLAEKAFKSFGAASAGVIGEPAAAAIDILGGVDTAAAIRKRLSEVQTGAQREVPELGKEFKFEDLSDPAFYATKGVSVLPALIALVGTGAGAGGVGARGALGLASRLGATGKGLKAAKAIGEIGTSALVSRTLEGALEASGTYNQLLNEGVDREKAADAAAKVFRNNYALTGMDAAQYAAATLKLPPALSKGLVKWTANAVKLGVASGSEGLEELYQGYVAKSAQEYAKGMSSIDGLDAKEFWSYATRAPLWQQEEFVIGALFGLGFQVGEGALSKYGKTEGELRQAIKRNPQEVIQTLKGQADDQRADNATREQVAQQAFGKKFDDLTDEQKQKIVDKAAEQKTAEEDARIDEILQGEQAQTEQLEAISQQLYGKPYTELPSTQRTALNKRYKTLSEKAQAKKIDDAIAERVGLKKPKAEKPASKEAQPPVVEKQPEQAAAALVAPTEPVTKPAQEKPEVVTPKAEGSHSQSAATPSPVSARAGEESQPSKTAVVDKPLSEIATDTDRFQNRATDFSEKTAATVAERFDPNLFDPIVLWKDPQNGKDYVLSGHSRLEGMKRRGAKNVPSRYFQGTEAEAMNFAKVEANRLGSAENLRETIKAYKQAKRGNATKSKLKDLFDGDVDFLESAQNLNESGDFIRYLGQGAATEFPYIKRFSRWVGELRKTYGDKITDRHEQQVFDWLYKGEKRNREVEKERFFELIEKQVNRTDFDPNAPLQLKRGEAPRIGTRGRTDTAKLEAELDQLRLDKKNARTPTEAQAIDKEIARVEIAIKTLVKTQPDLFGEVAARPVPKESTTPTHKQFDLAFERFQEVAAQQKGKSVPEQSAAIAEELRKQNVSPVIIDELTNPRRALKPRSLDSERSATSRPERIARAAPPPSAIKQKVDAIAQANVDFRNKESAMLKAREEIKADIEARGGEVVVDTDSGAMTITLRPGKSKIGEADQALIERIRKEAAEAGAYSLATVGQGFEISATPENIAAAESLPAGEFKARALEFLRRNAEAKSADKVFRQSKEDARNDLVDYYLAERVAGKDTPSALLGRAKDGTRVEVMARRVRSEADPDLTVGGRNFPEEIATAKKDAKARATETGEPFIESRKSSERQISRAQLRGTFISARDILNETEHESGTVVGEVGEKPLVVRESESSYNARPIKPIPNKFTVDIPTISLDDFKGKKVFIFSADRMRVGEYTGLEKNSGIKIKLQGGPLFPFIKQNFGKSAWAFSNKKAVNGVSNRIANSDGIGLVMLQGDSGVKGSKTFLEILFAELQHGLNKKDYSQKDLLKLIDEARKRTITQYEKIKGDEFKGSDDLTKLHRTPRSLSEVKQLLANTTFQLRSSIIDLLGSKTNVKEYGIPDINLIIAEVNDPIFKGMEFGDVVSAIQFDKNPKIGTAKELGSQEHFSYGIQISGKGLGLFQAPYDVRDILKIEKPKPHAARSAFLRQPVQKIEKKVKRGAFVAEQSEGYQPNRPGDFLTNPEAVFEQKPYEPNYKKRPDATPRTDRLAKEFVNDIGKNRRRGRVYLANAITAEAREKGSIGLVDKTIRSTDDVAVAGQVTRDPRVEHLRYILVKGEKSVGSYEVGLRLPSATAAFPHASTKEGLEWLRQIMKESGADGYYMLHNHPSGDVSPSKLQGVDKKDGDIEVTKTIADNVPGFKGHVIIDSNKYATLTLENGEIVQKVTEKFFAEEKLLVPSIDNPLIGRKVEDANDLMAIGKAVQSPEGWVTVIGATPDSRIRGIAEVEEAILQTPGKRRAALIRKFARDTGSASVFLSVDQKFFDANKDTLKKAVEQGFIVDAVSSDGRSILSEFPGLKKQGDVFFGKEIESGRVVKEGEAKQEIPDQTTVEEPSVVREPESTYGKAGLNREQFLDLGKMVNDFLQDKEQVAKLSKEEREEFAAILDVLKEYKELSEKADLSPAEKMMLKYAIRDIESPEGRRVIEKVQAALRDNKPGWIDRLGSALNSGLEKIAEWSGAMKLWRLSSVAGSAGGNLFSSMLIYPEMRLSAWFNKGIARRPTVERTRFSEEAKIHFKAAWMSGEIKNAARQAIDIMKEKPGAEKESKFLEREHLQKKAIKGPWGKYIRASYNAQGAVDVLCRKPLEVGAIAVEAFREGMKGSKTRLEGAQKGNPIARNILRLRDLRDRGAEVPEHLKKYEPFLERAEKEAEYRVFQSQLKGIAKYLSELRRYPAARILVPFFNTGMNILKQAYERTPLSIFHKEFLTLGEKYLRKSLTAEEAGRLSDRAAQITLGTLTAMVTTALLYGLSDDDEELITGDYDENTIGDKPAGWQQNSIRFGDYYVSTKMFQPYATIFTGIGETMNSKYGKVAGAAEALAEAFFDNPLTEEVFDVVSLIHRRNDKSMIDAANEFLVEIAVNSATPGLFQDISKIVDPTIRQKEGLEEQFKSKVGIPGLSTTLPERIDVFGEDLEPQTSGEKALKAITGVSISKSKEDPARREIRKLGLKHSLNTITHKGVSLEPWEVLALNKSIGAQYHETVLKLLQNPTYLAADKEARKAKLRSVRKGLIDKQKAILEKTPYFMARERVADAQKQAREKVKEALED